MNNERQTNVGNFLCRISSWITDGRLGTEIDQFATQIGLIMGRSNGLMLERARVCCRAEQPHIRRFD